jgi:glycosyltransferase involved in cell wall biosynthesis
MKFSILTPTFDRPSMLYQAIKSVTNQTCSDWELIIKDGCMARPAIKNFDIATIIDKNKDKIKYILSNDDGITNALNQALQNSTGDIICEMNDDDMLYDDNVLDTVKNRFNEHLGGEKWMYAKMVYIDKDGKEGGAGGRQTTLQELLGGNTICQPTVFWTKLLSDKIGGFDEQFKLAQDYDYWIRFWKECEPVFLDEFVAKYRLHEGSATSRIGVQQSADAEKVKQKHHG